jgi:hypothetical protein
MREKLPHFTEPAMQGCRVGDVKPQGLSASTDWRSRLTLYEAYVA